MAVYDPPQALWKRNVAGTLDFILSMFVFGYLFSKIFGSQPGPHVVIPGSTTTEMFGLGGLPLLFTAIAVVAYFILLGRTGGTIFQRLFQMKRASRA
ncbi:MAG: RDD family protein [Bradyrhizobium sp.]